MTYEPIQWQSTTLLSAPRFRHMETQYEEAAAYIDANLRLNTALEFRVETTAAEPAGHAGRVIFDTTAGLFKGYDGSTWVRW